MMKPKITVIIPSYNVETLIMDALDSIYEQGISKDQYEVLIIDDGSKDKTRNVVNDWINEKKVDNFKYYIKQNGNWGSVINYAKNNNLINGEYVTILDADDMFAKNCFSSFIEKMDKNYDLIFSNFYRKRMDSLIKTKVMFSKSKEVEIKKSFTAWSIPLCKFFKTELFLKQNDLREGVSYQDQILFHYFVSQCKSIYFIDDYLGIYFENREGSSTAQAWNENRINLWCSNMNKLLELKNNSVTAYVMMMIHHCYKNSPYQFRHLVKVNSKYVKLFKKAKFYWLQPGVRMLAKMIFTIGVFKIIQNSKKDNN